MPIPVACQSCGKEGLVSDAFAGRKIRCKTCGAFFFAGTAPASISTGEQDTELEDQVDDVQIGEESNWYYLVLGVVHGPVTLTTLKQLVIEAEIGPETHVRIGSTGKWAAA